MSNIYFVIETALTDEHGRSLKALTPDEHGYYQGIPMCVLGQVTRNNTFYNEDSVEKAMTSQKSLFYIRLKDGDLFGENGHPFIYKSLKDREASLRLFTLDPNKKACHYRKFYVKQDEGLDAKIVYSDLKPMGPYGKYTEELLLDSYSNFSTSLRGLSSETRQNGILMRNLVKLVTFDVNVPGGGYRYASKRYKDVSLENISELLTPETLSYIADSCSDGVAMESLITQAELNDIFELSKIKVANSITCYKLDKNHIYIQEDSSDHSIHHLTKSLL